MGAMFPVIFVSLCRIRKENFNDTKYDLNNNV